MDNQAVKEDTGLETGPGKSTNIDSNPRVEVLRKRLLGLYTYADEPNNKKLKLAESSGSDRLTPVESDTQIKQEASEGSAEIYNDALKEQANLETGPGKSTDLSLSKNIDSKPPVELLQLKLLKRLPVVNLGKEEPDRKKNKMEENRETVPKSSDEGSSQLDNLAQDNVTGGLMVSSGEQEPDVTKEADGKNVPMSSSDGSPQPDIPVQDNAAQCSSDQSRSDHIFYKLQTEFSTATSSTAGCLVKMTPRTQSLEKCNAAAAARILQLEKQVYKDWSTCLDADESGNLVLHNAIIKQDFVTVERQCVIIYARKQTLDIPNNMNMTPLHLAAIQGHPGIVTVLMKFGAQPGIKDIAGNNALHLAVIHGNLQCLKAIVNSMQVALPLDDYNHEGYAPLHLCALEGMLEETKVLISKGAKVDLKDARSGRTPLFHAVESLKGELMKLLLASGAKVNEPNFSGQTPLAAAHELSMTGPDVFPDELSIWRRIANLNTEGSGQ